MPNLKYIDLSAYKSNMYIYLDVKSSNTQTANTCTCTSTYAPTQPHTNAHLDTHGHLRAGGLKKKFAKRERFSRNI